MNTSEKDLKDLCDTIKKTNIRITWVLEEERDKIVKVIIEKNDGWGFPKIKEICKYTNTRNSRKNKYDKYKIPALKHIITKVSKAKYKEWILKAGREKRSSCESDHQ